MKFTGMRTFQAVFAFCAITATWGDAAFGQSSSETGDSLIAWRPTPDLTIRLERPKISIRVDATSDPLACRVESQSQPQDEEPGVSIYRVSAVVDEREASGVYRVERTTSDRGGRPVLAASSELTFDRPIGFDVCVEQVVAITGQIQPRSCLLPLRTGQVKRLEIPCQEPTAGYFLLGRGAAARRGRELAMPLLGIDLDHKRNSSLAFAVDPYCGVELDVVTPAAGLEGPIRIVARTTYAGSLVPVETERRTLIVATHDRGIDGMLASFYHAAPEIQPGAAWIHDIQLTYYDYLGEQGQGWFDDLTELARRIPRQHRGSVVVNLHGWYDYLGRYAFNYETSQLDDSWIAFPNTRKTPMSKAEIKRRMRFAKDLGFRAVLYFADGMNCDSNRPDFNDDWLLRDENGELRPGWTGPSTGKTYSMDPSNPEVREFFLRYMDAVLAEYGQEIDGLVWDETQYIVQHRLSLRDGRLAYADRDFMTLVAALTQRVQAARMTLDNPNLVFLTSDCLGAWGRGYVPYALVSHGTFQDTACQPQAWAAGLLPNYRNCLWSCNWGPLRNADYNRIAAEEYGLPQGLSNGYGDDVGPAQMAEEPLQEVIARFLKRASVGGRQRYTTDEIPFNPSLAPICTTGQDAAGGCDGLKTGTWGFCTGHQDSPWWQVDLGQAGPLDRVVIFNRCDADMEMRAARLRVLLSSDGRTWKEHYRHDGGAFFGFTDGKPLVVSMDGAKSRFVRICIPQQDYLHLDEVEVYAVGSQKNIALGRPADQSSVSPWSSPGPAQPLEERE